MLDVTMIGWNDELRAICKRDDTFVAEVACEVREKAVVVRKRLVRIIGRYTGRRQHSASIVGLTHCKVPVRGIILVFSETISHQCDIWQRKQDRPLGSKREGAV